MSFLDLKHLSSKEFRYGKAPEKQNRFLQDFIKPHIESFNYVVDEGLKKAISLIEPQILELDDGKKLEFVLQDAAVGSPVIHENDFHSKTHKIYPAECRERHSTYKSKLKVTLQWKIDGQIQGHITKDIAQVPIMVKSKVCSLANLSPKELVHRHEEAEEWGGYFIVNGNEKIIRMLIMPRRNYPLAMIRNSWKTKGQLFTEFGVSIRSVRYDQTGNTNVLHYLNDGTCTLAFIHMKEQFFIPLVLVLKALTPNSDYFIYNQMINGEEKNLFLKDSIAEMLRSVQNENLLTQKSVLAYIGERFRVKLDLPEWTTDEEVAMYLIRKCILMHLPKHKDKFNMLVFMTQKLFALAHGKCAQESPDNPMHQEVLLGGHVYLILLKDKLELWLLSLKNFLKKTKFKPTQSNILNAVSRNANVIGTGMEAFLATGNIMSKSGLGLMQTSGFAVVADKLNFMRYLSHFRCIHRGAFFSQMRTTSVRKLLPEACGFLCPVHTPDGAPCGLLNHLAAHCKVENRVHSVDHMTPLLVSLGMTPLESLTSARSNEYRYNVLFNGKLIGKIHSSSAVDFTQKLRLLKVSGARKVPNSLEVCLIPQTKYSSQYPGVFIFTDVARMIRPVKNLALNKIEYIGSFEQVYMDIAVCAEEIYKEVTTHLEINELSMLSALATLTPYSNYNQSPRNVYQCQMGKQTMGVPCQALKHRSDNKMYRIQTAQAPIVRNETYSLYGIDNFPLGINAVVAVISNTGYDMEDAMIINKGSLERGFAHGQIYKTEVLNLAANSDTNRSGENCYFRFGADIESDAYKNGLIDKDGLPYIGRLMNQHEVYYSYHHLISGEYKQVKYKHMEPAYIDDIKLIGNDMGDREMNKASVKLRIQRNPIIGDKFASRHGQKGILSQKWPMVDMPFTESGMTPDIIFNPHGFPSRMTIGMIIESMAGKSASLHGLVHNSTPFIFSEQYPAADYMGEMLTKAGYNYYGNETMYSGTNGKEMEIQIFIGIVYYQRLRHMVADKFQVRTTGPIDNLTHQPVQGRKRQGGIRFGEMERDALIAHGSGFLLHDRLFNCSDKFESHVCSLCGSLLSPVFRRPSSDLAVISTLEGPQWVCQICKTGKGITKILVPYVFKYLVAELAAMNIKVGLNIG